MGNEEDEEDEDEDEEDEEEEEEDEEDEEDDELREELLLCLAERPGRLEPLPGLVTSGEQ